MAISHTPKVKLFLGILVLSVISIVYLFISASPSSTPPPPSSPVTPAPSLSSKIQLLSVDPPAGTQNTFWTTTAIEFKFDQPINILTLSYQVTPSVETVPTLGANPHSLYLRPKDYWSTETSYQIILKALRGTSGSLLSQPINYNFKIVPPQDIISY